MQLPDNKTEKSRNVDQALNMNILPTLWINHKWPTTGISDNDAIVNAEIIDRQSGNLPGTDLYWVP